MASPIVSKTVAQVGQLGQYAHYTLDDGSGLDLPNFFLRFLRHRDVVRTLAPGNDALLVDRSDVRAPSQCLLYSRIGYVAQPKPSKSGLLARAELPEGTAGPRALFLSGEAIVRYFYALDGSSADSNFYSMLGVSESATAAELRTAWRIRRMEFSVKPGNRAQRIWLERAFNILAHPDLRSCYDALRRDRDAAPLFPYGGFGSILVEGNLSSEESSFFANRILAYKPEMTSRRSSLLLRQCDFLADRVICRDARRKLELWLDASLLPGLEWDLTWNYWKHWLATRVQVDATFVRTGKYRFRRGEWELRTWQTVLPSRVRVLLPGGAVADVEKAKAIHAMLGQYAVLIEKIRAETDKQPVEHVQIQNWLDSAAASPHLKPQYVTWRPDYESYFFDQLRKRCTTWFLFRDEYLFVWANVLIAEIPEPGHATYVFAKPRDVSAFMSVYARATREDVRRNRDKIADALGFVGRCIRGRNRKRWLAVVLRLAGEKADYLQVLE